jgi:hypothetical protein
VSDALSWVRWEQQKQAPSVHSLQFFFCLPNVFKGYHCLFGFTGSLGGEVEKKYVQRVYKAMTIKVPKYLETCTDLNPDQGVPKRTGPIAIFENDYDWMRQIINVAAKRSKVVPVIIIFEKATDVRTAFNLFKENPKTTKRTQLLLPEPDCIKGDDTNYPQIVERATKQIEEKYQITVTNYFGGRGHDYRVVDQHVDR